MAEASEVLKQLKEVLDRNLNNLKQSFSLEQGHAGYTFVNSFTKYVSNQDEDFEIEILEKKYILKPFFYPTQRFLILKTYQRVQNLGETDSLFEHIPLMDVFMTPHDNICLIHPERKKIINFFSKEFTNELYYDIQRREKEYFDSIKDNVTY